MTNEEALKKLKTCSIHGEPWDTAFTMAVKALEKKEEYERAVDKFNEEIDRFDLLTGKPCYVCKYYKDGNCSFGTCILWEVNGFD